MRSFLFSLLLLFAAHTGHTQCGECTPDTDCILSPAYPTLCPSTLPDATAGEYYETDITFYTPYEFFDPDNGVDVVFNQVTVTGTTGLPFGMSIQLNEPSGVYTPQQSEHGCARLCGNPLSPGTYSININIVATVFIPSIGIDVNQNQAFELELTVLPGSGGNNSFTADVSSGCDSLFVDFEALLDAAPNPTAYNWDFGNGETSNQKIPPTQFYGDTGTYEVSLETQFLEYVITNVQVNSVNDNWCGDAEEVTCDGLFGILPDIYVVILDASGTVLYQSGSTDNTLTGSWSELNIVANNPPFTIQVWDADAVSANDALGSFSFNISEPGAVGFSGAGGTSGSLQVTTQVSDSFFNTETITVFPSPSPTLSFDDMTSVLSVDADTNLVAFTWFYNDEIISGEAGPEITLSAPGEYYVVAQNGFGCFGASEVFVLCPVPVISYDSESSIITVDDDYATYVWFYNGVPIEGADDPFLFTGDDYGVYSLFITTDYGCSGFSAEILVCPTVEISVSPDATVLSVPDVFESYQWVQDGIPIPGANSNTYEPSNGGSTYWVIVTTDYGCQISAAPIISTVSIAEHALGKQHFTLYPNPAVDGFNLRTTLDLETPVDVAVTDMNGRQVKRYGTYLPGMLGQEWFGIDGLTQGIYLVVLSNDSSQTAIRLVVR